MKRFLAGSVLLALAFTGCELAPLASPSEAQGQITGKVQVVTSFYPLYEIARQIGGDYVQVKNLVPPGAEPHDYDLTPKDIAGVYESRILFVNGAGLEPWLDKLSSEVLKHDVRVIDASKLFDDLVKGDPHIWLDPVHYMKEVDAFEKTLSAVDPAHHDYYAANAQKFNNLLSALSADFSNGLQNCASREFVTNHAAFAYLAGRYGLTMVSVAGLSPEAEPSPKTLAGLTDFLRERKIKYVLTESLVSPKIAETLAREVGAQTMIMNPLEGLTDEEIALGKNYLTVMRDNLKNLQIAMDCR